MNIRYFYLGVCYVRKYKYLTSEEVVYYRSLSPEELEKTVELKGKELYNKDHVNYKEIQLGKPFHVMNGNWDGFIEKELDRTFIYVLKDGNGINDVVIHDITESYELNLNTGLSIYHFEDEYYYSELRKIYRDKTTYAVMGGKADCDHEYEAISFDGINCIKCNAWYCI